jgi:hypothetical protein
MSEHLIGESRANKCGRRPAKPAALRSAHRHHGNAIPKPLTAEPRGGDDAPKTKAKAKTQA